MLFWPRLLELMIHTCFVIFTRVVFVAFNPPFHLSNLFNYFFIFCFYVRCQGCNFSNCFSTHFCTGYVFIQSSHGQLDRHYPTTVVKTQINFFGVSGRTLVHARTARLQRLMLTNELFLLLPPTRRFQVPKQVLGLD